MSLTLRPAHSTQRIRIQTSTVSPVAIVSPQYHHSKPILTNGPSNESAIHQEEGTPSPRKRAPSNALFTFPSAFLMSPSTEDAHYTLDTQPHDDQYQPLSESKGNAKKGQQWMEHDHYYQTVLAIAGQWTNSCLVSLFGLCYILLIFVPDSKATHYLVLSAALALTLSYTIKPSFIVIAIGESSLLSSYKVPLDQVYCRCIFESEFVSFSVCFLQKAPNHIDCTLPCLLDCACFITKCIRN